MNATRSGCGRLWSTANQKRACSLLLFLAISFAPEVGFSWGRLGHRVSAEFAEYHLTPAARKQVRSLLDTGESLADAATWADDHVESSRNGPWHYVNVPVSEPRYASKFCPREGCVVSKIEDFKRTLENSLASREERQEALRYLIHFIQDLHQPLHVGDTGSRGGNTIQVRFYGERANLHQVWDSLIMERHSTNIRVWLWELDGLANPRMVSDWSKSSPEEWATESLEEAKLAYRLPGHSALLRSGARLGNHYCNFALPIIQMQIAKSGIRVASTLNAIFK
jgi:hypothetical protein